MDVTFGFGFAGLCLAIAWYQVRKLEHANPFDQLERLGKLRDEGLLSDDEFESLRQRRLKRLKQTD